MIKNQVIIDKVKSKTPHDKAMQEYLLSILQNESEGKQFKKFFTKGIKDGIAKREANGGEST